MIATALGDRIQQKLTTDILTAGLLPGRTWRARPHCCRWLPECSCTHATDTADTRVPVSGAASTMLAMCFSMHECSRRIISDTATHDCVHRWLVRYHLAHCHFRCSVEQHVHTLKWSAWLHSESSHFKHSVPSCCGTGWMSPYCSTKAAPGSACIPQVGSVKACRRHAPELPTSVFLPNWSRQGPPDMWKCALAFLLQCLQNLQSRTGCTDQSSSRHRSTNRSFAAGSLPVHHADTRVVLVLLPYLLRGPVVLGALRRGP